MNTNFQVIGLTRLGIEPQVYRSKSRRSIPLGHLIGLHSLSCFFYIELFRVDFPSNIASKSLTDKPSPLKKVRNSRSKSSTSHDGSRGSSTDPADADVDSDSGYYRSVFNFGIKLAVVHRPIKCEKIAQL